MKIVVTLTEVIVLLSLVNDSLTVPVVNKTLESHVRIVSGSYTRKLEDTVIYTGSAPLYYQLQFNVTESVPVTINQVDCETDHPKRALINAGKSYMDVISDRLEALQESLLVTPYTKAIDNYYTGKPQRFKRGIVSDALGDFLSYCCSVVNHRQFNALWTDQAKMTDFLKKLKSSVITDNQNIVKIKDSFTDLSSNLTSTLNKYQTAIKNVVQKQREVWGPELEWVERYSDRLSVLIFHVIQNLNRVTEIQQYSDILSHCRNGLIPITAVPLDTLRRDMQGLESELNLHGHKLAIPLDNVMAMYSFPIASCSFAKNIIGIHIRVPIKRDDSDFTLYEVVNIPFVYENSVCTLAHSPTYLARDGNDVVAIQGTQLSKCPVDSGLCYVPEWHTDPQNGAQCMEKILKGSP